MRSTLLTALILTVSCAAPSQSKTAVVISVDADPEVRTQATSVRVFVRSGVGARSGWNTVYDEDVKPLQWPFSFSLSPFEGDNSRGYEVVVTANDDPEAISRARIISGYVTGQVLSHSLQLEAECIGLSLSCKSNETCVVRNGAAACRDAEVDPTALSADGGTDHDAGSPINSGVRPDDSSVEPDGAPDADGATDGALDAAADATQDATADAVADTSIPDCDNTQLNCGAPGSVSLEIQPDGTATGTVSEANFDLCNNVSPISCTGDFGVGVPGREAIYEITMPFAGTVSVETLHGGVSDNLGLDWSAATYILTTCGDATSAVACNGAISGGAPYTVTTPTAFTDGQVIYIVIDSGEVLSNGKGARGSYQMTITATPASTAPAPDVACGTTASCSLDADSCCITEFASDAAVCEQNTLTCTEGGRAECDGPDDCAAGQECCILIDTSAMPASITIECKAAGQCLMSPLTLKFVMCNEDADCPADTNDICDTTPTFSWWKNCG